VTLGALPASDKLWYPLPVVELAFSTEPELSAESA
jgi:hypothetical protein